MDTKRQARPPVRTSGQRQTRPSVRRPVRKPIQRQTSPINSARRRKKKPRIDITLTILDFFANIGRGIKRGYLRARSMRHFAAVFTFISIAFVISVAALVFFIATRPNALEIHLDEGSVSIGTIRTQGNREVTLEHILSHSTARLETQLGSHVRFVSEVEANPVRLSTGATSLTFDNLVTALIDALDYYIWGAVIIVNGSEAAMLPSSAAAESLLTDIAQGLRQGGGVMSFHGIFAENIDIRQQYIRRTDLMTRQEAYSTLTAPRPTPGIHIVQRGDTFWGIEQATGMSIDDLIAANPNVNHLALQEGQRISVVRNIPILTAREAD